MSTFEVILQSDISEIELQKLIGFASEKIKKFEILNKVMMKNL